VNKRKRKDFIRLNFVLSSDKLAINNIDRINELRESVYVSQIYQDCAKTLYVLFIFAFYFELANVLKRFQEN